MEGESIGALDGGLAGRLDGLGSLLKQGRARLQRLQEGIFLGDCHAQDALAVVLNLRVGRGHGVHDGVHELLHGVAGRAQKTCGANDPTEQAAQDVATALIARGDTVEDEHHAGAGVVGDDTEANVVLVLGAIGRAG